MADMQHLQKYQKKEWNMDSLDQVEMQIDDGKWIMEILFKRLYMQPIRSICREIISNAIDAQKRIKVTDRIEIIYPTNAEPMLVIRDFGVGMNEEEIRNVYTKIGKTTKTLHDDEIGGFGIGSKSPFAYGDFQVESVKDGEKIIAWIYQDSGGSFVLKMIKEPSTERTGTAIKIPVKLLDISEWRKELCFYQNTWGAQEVNYKRELKVATTPYCKRVVEKFCEKHKLVKDIRCWINTAEVAAQECLLFPVFTWRGVPYSIWDYNGNLDASHIIEFVLDPDKVIPSPSREFLTTFGSAELLDEKPLKKEIMDFGYTQVLGPWAFDERMTQQDIRWGGGKLQPVGLFFYATEMYTNLGVTTRLKNFDWFSETVRCYDRVRSGRSEYFTPVKKFSDPPNQGTDLKTALPRIIKDRHSLPHHRDISLVEIPEEEPPKIIYLNSRGARSLFCFNSGSEALEQLRRGVDIPILYEVDDISVESPFKAQLRFPREQTQSAVKAAKPKKWKTNNYRQLDMKKLGEFLLLWQKTRGYSFALSTLIRTCFTTKPIDPTRRVFLIPHSSNISPWDLASLATVMLFPTEEPIQIVFCPSESKKKSLQERLGPLCIEAHLPEKKFEALFFYFSEKEKAKLLTRIEKALKKHKIHLLGGKPVKEKNKMDRVRKMMDNLFFRFPNLITQATNEYWGLKLYRNFFGVLGGVELTDLQRSERFTILNFYAACIPFFETNDSRCRASRSLAQMLTWDSVLNLIKRTKGVLGDA